MAKAPSIKRLASVKWQVRYNTWAAANQQSAAITQQPWFQLPVVMTYKNSKGTETRAERVTGGAGNLKGA
jgi:hypothetical protein